MDVNDAFIEIAQEPEFVFQGVGSNDIVLYQTNADKTMHVGARQGIRANIRLTQATVTLDTQDTIYLATRDSNVLTVASNNAVGIGTTTPTEKLTVQGNLAVVDGSVLASSGTTNTPGYAFAAASDTGLFLSSSNDLVVSVEGAERIAVTTAGHVGFGTTTPSEEVEVVGTVRATAFKIGTQNVRDLFAPSNQTSSQLGAITITAEWASNNTSNLAFAADTDAYLSNTSNVASNALDTARWASNTGAYASNTFSNYATSNTVYTSLAWTSNSFSNVVSVQTYSVDKAWLSNTSAYASNQVADRPTTSFVDTTYARSNYATAVGATATWTSNLGVWGSNTAVWTSNFTSNLAQTSTVASTYATITNLQTTTNTAAYASNTATYASNNATALSNAYYASSNRLADRYWTSNNTSVYTNSNVGIGTANPAYKLDVSGTFGATQIHHNGSEIQTKFALSNQQSNWAYASNTANWTSNSLSNMVTASTAASTYAPLSKAPDWNWGSNIAAVARDISTWTSNALPSYLQTSTAVVTYAASNRQSNWNFASNAAAWASNTAYAGSNVGFWASNYLVNVATVYGVSNWNYGSNTATWASNTAQTASTTSTWSSNNFVNFTRSTNASNWNYASNTAFWASNSTSNFAMITNASNWNYASNTAKYASNALPNYALSNAQSNWNYASNTATWASNTAASTSTFSVATSNALSNYALSNSQSNWNYASNLAYILSNNALWNSNATVYTSNALNSYAKVNRASNWDFASNTASFSSNTLTNYALSNRQSNWNYASNAATYASNTAATASNAAVYASNTLGSYAASNAQSNWNYASNTVYYTSNAAIYASNQLPNYLTLIVASNSYATQTSVQQYAVSNQIFPLANFASNMAVTASNYATEVNNNFRTLETSITNSLSNYVTTENLISANNGAYASNVAVWASNGVDGLTRIFNEAFGCNTGVGAALSNATLALNKVNTLSNNLATYYSTSAYIVANYAASNAQSNWNFASNTASYASNTAVTGLVNLNNSLTNYLLLTQASNAYAPSNQQSNWNYASNTATWASNTGAWTSNNTSNMLSLAAAATTYASSNGQSNWNYASNTATYASNAFASYPTTATANAVYAASNGQSNWNYASNTAHYASNALASYPTTATANAVYAASNGQSNWNYGSNTAHFASNALTSYPTTTAANAAYAASNGQSNWNYASNTATFASNALTSYPTTATANAAYAASNGQSNWNYASNTATYASNALTSYPTTTTANAAYAASNGQSNWNYASNTSAYASNIAEWTSNNSGGRYWTSSSSNVTTSSNVGIGTTAPSERLTINNGNVLIQNLGAVVRLVQTGIYLWRIGYRDTSSTSDLSFLAGNSSVEHMTLKSSGRVGLGTTAPSYTLDVIGDINTASNLREGGATLVSLYASSNGQSNWNYASNTSSFASNALTSYPTTTTANAAYAASNGQSNWNYASNTANFASNALMSYSTTTTANNDYAASNGQSNWNYGSNTANWASNNAGGRYWTSATSNVTTSSNVGIGTTSPTERLQVVNGDINIANGAGGGAGGALKFGTGAQSAFAEMASIKGVLYTGNTTFSNLSGGMIFYTRSNNTSSNTTLAARMLIGQDGRVGIATSTPYYTLDVEGTLRATGATYVDSNLFFGSTGRQMINLYQTAHGIGVQGSTTYFRTTTTGDFHFYKGGVHSDTRGDPGTGGTALLSIKDTGKVGIGTTAPQQDLHVASPASTTASVIMAGNSNNSNFLGLYSGTSTDPNPAIVYGSNVGLRIGSWTSIGGSSYAERIRIDSSGNVGIATTSPAYRLDVAGSFRALSNILVYGASYHVAFTLSNSNVAAEIGLASSNGSYSAGATSNDLVIRSASNNNLILQSGNGNACIFVNSNNTVGILTTTPAYKLDVNGDTIVRGWIRTTGNTGWYSETHQGGWYMTDSTWLRSHNSKSINTGGNIVADGRIGIKTGLVTPSYELDVRGVAQIAPATNTSRPLLILNATVSNNATHLVVGKIESSYNAGFFNFQHLGTDGAQSNYVSIGVQGQLTSAPINITGYGNVGIGTNAPATKLVVAGEVTSTNATGFRIIQNNYGAMFRNDGTDVSILSTPNNAPYNTGLPGQLFATFRPFKYNLISGLVTLGNTLYVQDAGNVGIGDSSPNEKLTVTGRIRADTSLTQGISVYQTGSGPAEYYMDASATGGATKKASVGIDTATRNFFIWVNGSDRLNIDSTGKVGIGRNVMSYNLDVNGNSRATDMYTDNNFYTGGGIYNTINTATYGSASAYAVNEVLSVTYSTNAVTNGNGSVYVSAGDIKLRAQSLTWTAVGTSAAPKGAEIYLEGGKSPNTAVAHGGIMFRTGGTNISSGADRMTITGDGFVGIATTTPKFPLQVSSGAGSSNWSGTYGYLTSAGGGTATTTSLVGSIYASSRVVASEFNAFSDQRVKKDIVDIDDLSALGYIRQIEPKQYKYIDYINRGSSRVWGFLAQQVESVLDYAVTTISDFLPNIFKHANVAYKRIMLDPGATTQDLAIGDKVKLYIDDKNTEKIVTVTKVLSTSMFEIDEFLDTPRIFVFGKQVDDFKTLNKDAIYTLNVAAVQELDRELQEAKTTIATLLQRVQALEARLT